MSRPHNPLVGATLGLLAFGLYAGYDISIKFLGGDYSSFQIMFFAGLMAFPMVVTHALFSKDQGSLKPKQPGLQAVRTFVVVVNGVLGTYAFANLPLAQCYAIFFCMPLFITLLGIPLLGERIDFVRGAAVLCGFVGVLIAVNPSGVELVWAHAAAIVATAFGALNYTLLRRTGGVERTAVLMLYPMVAQLVFVTIAMPFVYQPMPLRDMAITAFMGLVLVLGSLCVIAAYRSARAIVVAPMQYSQIIWAAIFGAFLFGETLTTQLVIGIGLIIASGLVVVARQDPAP
jgi:S-adenosylmethionine uptake transporter